MTVKELRKKLASLPDECVVQVYATDEQIVLDIEAVSLSWVATLNDDTSYLGRTEQSACRKAAAEMSEEDIAEFYRAGILKISFPWGELL